MWRVGGWAGISGLMLLAGMWSPLTAQEPATENVAPETVAAQLVPHLISDKFADRQAAEQGLRALGLVGLEAVAAVPPPYPPEFAARAALLMEEFAHSSDPTVAEAAEKTLEEWAAGSDASLAFRAQYTLSVMLEGVRRQRSVAKLQELGATLVPMPVFGNDGLRFVTPDNIFDADIQGVILGGKWKGGVEGLKLLLNFPELQMIEITPRVKFSGEALEDIVKQMPNPDRVIIRPRAPAYLGVRGSRDKPFCIVDQVSANSPAARGGMKDGDIVVAVEGYYIDTFDNFVSHLQTFEPGDEIEIIVARPKEAIDVDNIENIPGTPPVPRPPAEIVTLNVTLDEW